MSSAEGTLRIFVALLVAAGICCGSLQAASPAPDTDDSRVDLVLVTHLERGVLEGSDLPVIWKGASFFLALWDAEQQSAAAQATVPFEVLAKEFDASRKLQLIEAHHDQAPPEKWSGRVLWHEGRKWILEMDDREIEELDGTEFSHQPLARESRGWPSRAPSVAYDCSYDSLVDGLLGGTSQARWMDWIEKISGVENVLVDGSEYTIKSRYSSLMFAGSSIAKGYDFALQQAQSWNYDFAQLEEHSFTGTGGQTWKNLVLTIPGQTTPNELVLLTGHMDSINPSNTSDAPGANDNGTGTATLFEAARLMRQYRFERTIKIIFFTGEEQGLVGSGAWVDDHPTNNILGVVNLDMFGWDGDGDRCFEIHAGTMSASQDVADCYSASISSYGLGLLRDYLTTGATDRSDHASFWQVGVGAIEIAENFFNDNLSGGCVGQDNNPGYHTASDTIAQNMHPTFGFDVARAGMATIAAMAKPIEACFDTAPLLSAVPGVNQVDLSWSPVTGAASYRISRSTQGCDGQWQQIGTTTAGSYSDVTVGAATYSYRVEAVDPDGFCVSAQSNCATATPTVYHARSAGIEVLDSCPSGGPGDGDGVLDPGEIALLPVTLENDGNAMLTQVSGTLTVAPGGVTVTDPGADWPDLSPGGVESTLPDHFGVQVSAGATCGTLLAGTITVNYVEGSNITNVAVPVGNPFDLLLVDENFSAGIPASWTVVDGGSGGGSAATWTTDNPGGRSIDPPFDSDFAIVDSDEAGSGSTQDESLITLSFDGRSCQSLYLEFDSQFHHYSGSQNETADVDMSTDGGVNWSNKLRIQGGDDGYTTPVTKTVPLESLFGTDLADVRVRFRYYDGSYEWWWAIDNVKVHCELLECRPCQAPASAPGEAASSAPLTIDRDNGNLVFDWGIPDAGCLADDYAVYRGDLTTLGTTGYSHDQVLSCATGGTSLVISETDPGIGAADYYLVVSDNGVQEGSYGSNSDSGERPISAAACHATQDLSACGP